MSMHKIPLTSTEEAGFRAHGLQRDIGKPSQLADVFRQGVAWGIAAERERCARLLDAAHEQRKHLDNYAAYYARMIRECRLIDGPNDRAKPPEGSA